jgi:hypothetical protein
MISGE